MATTREHAPALGFFPKNQRIQLITVPSCSVHNHDKQDDDTFIRNLICMQNKSNPVLIELASTKVIRSLEYDNRQMLELADSQIGNTPLFVVDETRVDQYFTMLSYAIFRHDFQRNYLGEWFILENFLFRDITDRPPESLDLFANILNYVKQIPFLQIETKNPEVFCYYRHIRTDGKVLYRFQFYSDNIIYAYTREKCDE